MGNEVVVKETFEGSINQICMLNKMCSEQQYLKVMNVSESSNMWKC
jgi:hypothetical protein